jgi:hypothetical protein
LVHCGPADGHHTAANIAALLDKAISTIPGLPSKIHKVCTSDNASNMLAAIPKKTEQIHEGLGCIDHLLNLVVTEANKEIADSLKIFTDLSSRTRRAPLDQQRIKLECSRINKDGTLEPGKTLVNFFQFKLILIYYIL